MNEADAFQEFLRQRNLKLTQQRRVVLDRTLELRKHFSAEELFEELRAHGISKATVYRTLALLVEAGLLEALDFERGHKVYERAGREEAHHDHLICLGCNQIIEFHNEQIEQLQTQVARRYDFEMVSHTHQIFGVCSRCRRQGVEVDRAAARVRARAGHHH